MTQILLLSTYEQGHQPLGLAAPAASLRARGHDVQCVDTAVQSLTPETLDGADLVGISVLMHTAARLGIALSKRVRALNPSAKIVFYGLYASELHDHLVGAGLADAVVGGEYEIGLANIAESLEADDSLRGADGTGSLPLFPRQQYLVPDRAGLPALDEYARYDPGDGDLRLAGYVEASRGCAHVCTHCPLTPTYGGRLRLVQPDVVLADIDALVSLGAEHITFGDPDFFNAIAHADQITSELHRRYPTLTFDATIKVEHLLEHADRIGAFQTRGLSFVTSAFESVDDRLLALLKKGHTQADLEAVLSRAKQIGLTIRPTWLPFTPWTSIQDFLGILNFVAERDLVHAVQPVQYALRLLLPPGSPLVAEAEHDGFLTGFDSDGLSHSWRHPDPLMDTLQARFAAYTSEAAAECDHDDGQRSLGAQFDWIRAETEVAAGVALSAGPNAQTSPPPIPGLTESWFC